MPVLVLALFFYFICGLGQYTSTQDAFQWGMGAYQRREFLEARDAFQYVADMDGQEHVEGFIALAMVQQELGDTEVLVFFF